MLDLSENFIYSHYAVAWHPYQDEFLVVSAEVSHTVWGSNQTNIWGQR
jgi:hypothetical protein